MGHPKCVLRENVSKWSLSDIALVLVVGPAAAGEKPAKPIKRGVLFIMPGPMGGYGKHESQTVQLSLDGINAKGGILGRKAEAI